MTVETILNYCMHSPDNTNRVILVEMLERLDGAPDGRFSIEYVADYVMHTKYNTNRMVLEDMLRFLKNDHPIRTKRTVLYTDGTFIINELEKDEEENERIHGEVVREYPPLDSEHDYDFPSSSDIYWQADKSLIKFVKFGSSIKPISMSNWFQNTPNLETFDPTNLNTSDCTKMNFLFGGSSTNAKTKFTYVDVSSFNTSKVTRMDNMFQNCPALTNLDVSGFNTSNVTQINNMFQNCSALTNLDVSGFDTSKVSSLHQMFDSCSLLTNLDVSSFNTSQVTRMDRMFHNCSLLTTIYASSSFIVEQVTESGSMFASCTSLVGGQGTTYLNTTAGKDKTRARIDNPPDAPGYFTAK